MTPQVARYLSASIDVDEAAALATIDSLLAMNPYITPWQASWLAPALSRAKTLTTGPQGQIRGQWLLSVWNDTSAPEPIRAALATTLARHGLITKAELLTAFDEQSDIGRPALAAALGIAVPTITDPAVVAVCAEDDLVKWSYEWGVSIA